MNGVKETEDYVRFTVDELILPSGNIVHSARFIADVIMIDEGIGSYEYWGSRCVDVDWQPAISTITYLDEEHEDEVDAYIEDNFDDLEFIALEYYNKK